MKVVLSEEVKLGIAEYKESLKKYPISRKRREEKVRAMRRTLAKLGGKARFAVCDKEDLGQIKDENDNIMNNKLYMIIHKDEKSKKTWTFSYYIKEKPKQVVVVRMMYSPFVKDNFIPKIDKPYKRIFDDVPMNKKARYPFLTHILDCRRKHPELFY